MNNRIAQLSLLSIIALTKAFPQAFTNGPSVVANEDHRLEIFARASDGSVWHNWQTSPGGAWNGWSPLGGVISGTPSVSINADGRLEVFVVGEDQTTYHKLSDLTWRRLVRLDASWAGTCNTSHCRYELRRPLAAFCAGHGQCGLDSVPAGSRRRLRRLGFLRGLYYWLAFRGAECRRPVGNLRSWWRLHRLSSMANISRQCVVRVEPARRKHCLDTQCRSER